MSALTNIVTVNDIEIPESGKRSCACGCGGQVGLTRSGVPNSYIHGHALKGKPKSEDQKRKQSEAMKGKPGPWKGKSIPPLVRLKLSIAHTGKVLSQDHRNKISSSGKGRAVSEETRSKQRCRKHTPETKKKMSEAQRGCKGSGWKGGVSAESDCIRASAEYRSWRLSVFRRDRFTCQDCGAKHRKGFRPELHAHHLKPFATHPDLRTVLDNGVTLCVPCHDIRHGRGSAK